MKTSAVAPGIVGSLLALMSAYISFSFGNSFARIGEFVPADPAEYARQMAEPIEPDLTK